MPHTYPKMARLSAGFLLAALAGSAIGDSLNICKYADKDGNLHYQSAPPRLEWVLIRCESTEDRMGVLNKALDTSHEARSKIKIGMTRSQMRAAHPLLRNYAHRRVVESASGKTEWLEFYDFSVLMRNGRVAAISH